MNFIDLTNYEKLLTTARAFAGSQGCYGRMLRQLEDLDEEQIEGVNNIYELTQCKDTLDVVMYLEG